MVTPDKASPGKVVVYDPQENYRVVHQGQTYDATRTWLQEDEYSLITDGCFLTLTSQA